MEEQQRMEFQKIIQEQNDIIQQLKIQLEKTKPNQQQQTTPQNPSQQTFIGSLEQNQNSDTNQNPQQDLTRLLEGMTRKPALKAPEPDRFSGTPSELENWLFQLELYFFLKKNATEQDKIIYTVSLLQGPATTLFRSGAMPNSFEELKSILRRFFKPVNDHDVARRELDQIRQMGDVRDYIYKFTNIALRIAGITEDEKKHRFISGLRDEVKKEVEMRTPQDFNEALSRAIIADSYFQKGETTQVDKRETMQVDKIWLNSSKEKLFQEGRCFY